MSFSHVYIAVSPTYLYFLFILESSFADNDVFNAPSVPKLLLKDGVVLEELLGLLFGNSIQGISVDHPHSLKLKTHQNQSDLYCIPKVESPFPSI